jgi:3'-phosphoadenosine 5'-phosphosulfate sulfotransferase (PAPS reductase)/FAD synthetase
MADGQDPAEARVDAMILRGLAVVDEAVSYVRNDLGKEVIAILAGFSGGDDSIVVTHFANTNVPGCVTFNADTMIGLGPTRKHIEEMIKKFSWDARIMQAFAEGPPSETKTNGELLANWIDGATAYEEYVLNHGFGGPPMHPRMYQRLKERPLMRLRRELAGGKKGGRLVVISGVRHDESAIRAGYKRSWQDVPKQGVTWCNPFYDFTAADFQLYRDEFGLPRNPVKRQCGISGECCCGTFGSPAERVAYRQVDPVFADYLDKLEARVRERFPWGWAEGPPTWWIQSKQGQQFLFDDAFDWPGFQPMCVGCNNGRR